MRLEDLDIKTLDQFARALWSGNRKVLGNLGRSHRRYVAMLVKAIRQAGGTFRKAGNMQWLRKP